MVRDPDACAKVLSMPRLINPSYTFEGTRTSWGSVSFVETMPADKDGSAPQLTVDHRHQRISDSVLTLQISD